MTTKRGGSPSRRDRLADSSGGGVGPLILTRVCVGQGYTHRELERNLARGVDVKNLTIHDLCTPALILDIDQFESNLTKMASYARHAGVNLRPHAKAHKCPAIGRRQIEAGATGLCVATLSEAEVMAESGLTGILITSELVGEPKIKRLMKLLKRHPDIMVVVDNAANVRQLGQAAEARNFGYPTALGYTV